MKDITKIVERIKKTGIKGTENIATLHEGIDALAKNITIEGGKTAVNTFKRFGIYDADYVKEKYPIFSSLVEEELKKKNKLKKDSNKSTEAEDESLKILDSTKGKKLVGYARVSSAQQNLDRQLKALKDAGCCYIFKEKKSGKNMDRIEFKSMLQHLREGDTLVVSELTRLARSTTDLFNIMSELESRGIQVKSLKESWLDTSSAHGKLMFTIMSGMAQFERELLLERQAEGIAVAKEKGIKFGRKLQNDSDIELAVALYKEGKYTTTQVAKMCNISRSTLWRTVKKLGLE